MEINRTIPMSKILAIYRQDVTIMDLIKKMEL